MNFKTHTSSRRIFSLFALLLLLFSGCDQPTLFGALDGETGEGLQISPDTLILPIHTDYGTSERQFSVTGGQPPYIFTVPGEAAEVGTITAEGIYQAPREPATDIAVRVTDEFGNTSESQVTATDLGPLEVTPATATVSLGARISVRASGGVPPYNFDFTGLGGTDEDLTSDEDGRTATYTAPSDAAGGAGVGDVTVTVTDNARSSGSATITVTEKAALGLVPATSTVQLGGSIELTAVGGVPPYSFSVTSGAGSVAIAADQLSATFTAPTDTWGTATIEVEDTRGDTEQATVAVAAPDVLRILPSTSELSLGESVDLTVVGGVPPYVSLEIVDGEESDETLIDGGDPSSATYTAPTDRLRTVTIRVSDGAAIAAQATATITVDQYLGTGIAPRPEVTNPQQTAGNGDVTLTWTDPLDASFASVEIWFGSAVSKQQFSGTIDSAGTTIPGLSVGQEYTFLIRTVSTDNDRSSGVTVTATPN